VHSKLPTVVRCPTLATPDLHRWDGGPKGHTLTLDHDRVTQNPDPPNKQNRSKQMLAKVVGEALTGRSIRSIRYAASLGCGDRRGRDMARTRDAKRTCTLREGGSGGQHIVDQQDADPADAAAPSWLHLDGALEVGGSLKVVEPSLVGHPAPKPQRRRDDQLTFCEAQQPNGRTGQQLQGCVPASSDRVSRRRDGYDEYRPVAGHQSQPKMCVAGHRRRHRGGQHRRQNVHQIPTVAILERHEGRPRGGVIRGGGPGRGVSGRTWCGPDARSATPIA
jgi:hypothetical protein